jgi:secreted trypsin-like serine protease
MELISHFVFRLSPASLVVFAGVLNNTVESSEDTKVVREVTEFFLHEKYDNGTLSNDIAILKVGLISSYEKQIPLHSGR